MPRAPTGPRRVPLGRTPRFERPQYDLPRTARRRLGFLVAAVIIVVLAIAAGVLWKEGFFSKSHTVPDLVGHDHKAGVERHLTSDGYTLSMSSRITRLGAR